MFDKEIETLKKQSIKIQQEQLDLDNRVSEQDTLIQQLKKATAEKNFALAAQLMQKMNGMISILLCFIFLFKTMLIYILL